MAWTKRSDARNTTQDVASPTHNTITVTIPSVSIGDAIVIRGRWGSATASMSTVSDGTNTYAIKTRYNDSTNGGSLQQAIAIATANATNLVVTITLSASVPYSYAYGAAWYDSAGLSPAFDTEIGNTQTAPGTGSNAVTTTAVTPSVNGCLILGHFTNENGSGTFTVGSSPNAFTQQNKYTVSGADIDTEESFVQTTAASIAATGTASSNTPYLSILMALKLVATGS